MDFKPYIETLLFPGTQEYIEGFLDQRAEVFSLVDTETDQEEDYVIVNKTYSSVDNLIRCQIEISSKEKESILQTAIRKGLIVKLNHSNQGFTPSSLN